MQEDRRFCVYLHKSIDGEVFYVGSGTSERAFTKELSESKNRGTCRGSGYSEKVKELGFNYVVEVVMESMTKEESFVLEEQLMDKYKSSIVNRNKPAKNVDLSDVLDKFYYNEDSPSFLSWKVDHYGCKAGSDVNFDIIRGYSRIKFRRKAYSAHRIIAALFGNEVNGKVVDHIDGNPLNNSISNLRVVSQRENRRNAKIRNDNTTGYSGIKFIEERKHWIFNWHENGRRNTRTFHIMYFNNDKELALKAAIEFREQKLLSMGYSDNHGK